MTTEQAGGALAAGMIALTALGGWLFKRYLDWKIDPIRRTLEEMVEKRERTLDELARQHPRSRKQP